MRKEIANVVNPRTSDAQSPGCIVCRGVPGSPLRSLLRPNANGHGVAAEPEPAPKRRVLLSVRVCVRRVRKSRDVRRGALKASLQTKKPPSPPMKESGRSSCADRTSGECGRVHNWGAPKTRERLAASIEMCTRQQTTADANVNRRAVSTLDEGDVLIAFPSVRPESS